MRKKLEQIIDEELALWNKKAEELEMNQSCGEYECKYAYFEAGIKALSDLKSMKFIMKASDYNVMLEKLWRAIVDASFDYIKYVVFGKAKEGRIEAFKSLRNRIQKELEKHEEDEKMAI